MSDSKPTNPKDALGTNKLPLHMWPATATALGSLALLDGAKKYGRSNWRHAGVRATVYNDAIRRHLDAWLEGEDADPDSGLDHLAHALAGLAILVDARAAGKLTDDRCTPGGYRASAEYLTAHVARLREAHAARPEPRHYSIADGAPTPTFRVGDWIRCKREMSALHCLPLDDQFSVRLVIPADTDHPEMLALDGVSFRWAASFFELVPIAEYLATVTK